jgi:hypothetical protein
VCFNCHVEIKTPVSSVNLSVERSLPVMLRKKQIWVVEASLMSDHFGVESGLFMVK